MRFCTNQKTDVVENLSVFLVGGFLIVWYNSSRFIKETEMSEFTCKKLRAPRTREELAGIAQLFSIATREPFPASKVEDRLALIRKESSETQINLVYRYEAIVGFCVLRYESNFRKNKVEIDELIVAGDYHEDGVGDYLLVEIPKWIKGKGHFENGDPIYITLNMDIPQPKKDESGKRKTERRLKKAFLKRNNFYFKRPPSKISGLSEYEKAIENK